MLGLALAAFLLSGCGGGSRTTVVAGSAQGSPTHTPTIDVPPGPPPKKLVIKEIVKGKGAAIPPIAHKPRVTIAVLYNAYEYETGELFEAWQNPREPYEVEYGPGLNPAWEEGLAGMKVGGRRELIAPLSMLFGSGSDGPLIYRMRLLSLRKNGAASYAREQRQGFAMSKREMAELPPLAIPRQSGPPPRQLKIVDLRKGSGVAARKQDSVSIRYYDVRYSEALQRSRSGRFGPRIYKPGEAVKGVAEGILGMKVGGRRVIVIPPKLVYPNWKPSWGYPRFTDVYVIDLLRVISPSSGEP